MPSQAVSTKTRPPRESFVALPINVNADFTWSWRRYWLTKRCQPRCQPRCRWYLFVETKLAPQEMPTKMLTKMLTKSLMSILLDIWSSFVGLGEFLGIIDPQRKTRLWLCIMRTCLNGNNSMMKWRLATVQFVELFMHRNESTLSMHVSSKHMIEDDSGSREAYYNHVDPY